MLDAGTTQPRRPVPSKRLVAALSYTGAVSLIILGLAPRGRFVVRHAAIAASLHLIRFAWCAVILGVWALRAHADGAIDADPLVLSFSTLLLGGFPWVPGLPMNLIVVLSLPLGFTWLCAAAGAGIALLGRTADVGAFLNADWSDPRPRPNGADRLDASLARAEDRSRLRELTERRLHGMWRASRVAASERRRVEQMTEIRAELDAVLSQLGNLNRMLSLGELSLTRFNVTHAELIEYLNELRLALADLEQRRSDVDAHALQAHRPIALDALPPVRVRTMAIVDPSGIPIRTYGVFPLDESIITGMVSAFESLTREMFGSQVHKTQLADGQVVHFVRGGDVVMFVIFEDEPAPEQIARMREFIASFEEANGPELRVLPIDPARLHEVPLPFEFVPDQGTDEPVAVPAPKRSIHPLLR